MGYDAGSYIWAVVEAIFPCLKRFRKKPVTAEEMKKEFEKQFPGRLRPQKPQADDND